MMAAGSTSRQSAQGFDLDEFNGWIGREIRQSDILALPLVQRLAAALDRDATAFAKGDVLPDGWHAVLFSPLDRTCDLDGDGHPKRGSLLPPIPLPRRLFAGRRLRFMRPLRLGDEVRRSARVTRIEQKVGKTGPLVFVTARYTLFGADGQPAVIEEQDVVYREEASKTAARGIEPHGSPQWTSDFTFSPTALFRFSASVFNAHRIHFDADYARNVEGYEGLVVNASFMTLHMLRQAEINWKISPGEVAVRNRGLLFVDSPINVQGCEVDGGRIIQAVQNGRLCVELKIDAE